MRRLVFRFTLLAALLVWAAILLDLSMIEYSRKRLALAALEAQRSPTVVAPTATPIIIPTMIPATPEALPGMVHGAAAQTEDAKAAAIHPKTGRYVTAWLPTTFDARNARASFEANKDVLDEVSPFWYGVRPDGRLLADWGSRDMELVRTARENNVLVIPTVHNIGNEDVAANVIGDPSLRARNIQAIVDEVLKYGYDGFDIDYEGLSRDMRPAFSDFIVRLGEELHKHDKLLTIAVHAKSQDYGGLGGFQDWKVIGEAVDRLRIMTYDYHWRGGGAGPISPIYWVEDVSEYAMSVVEPSKIVIGIPFYAYNWGSGESRAAAQTWTQVQNLIEIYQPSVNLAESNDKGMVQESWFTYRGRTVWFSNYRSLEAKLDLVQRKDLAGIAIWRLGNEDPENWSVIRRKLVQDPTVIQRQVNEYLPEH